MTEDQKAIEAFFKNGGRVKKYSRRKPWRSLSKWRNSQMNAGVTREQVAWAIRA